MVRTLAIAKNRGSFLRRKSPRQPDLAKEVRQISHYEARTHQGGPTNGRIDPQAGIALANGIPIASSALLAEASLASRDGSTNQRLKQSQSARNAPTASAMVRKSTYPRRIATTFVGAGVTRL